MKIYDVVFFGTPHFSTHALEALVNNKSINIKAVITGVDKKIGRGQKVKETAVATFAVNNGLQTYKTANINKESFLKDLGNVDFFMVVAFSQFLSKAVLELPTIGAFNIHTSLLPLYRGAAPIQYALLNGDQETGICLQKMVSKMDAGDIAVSRKISIGDKDTSEALFNRFESECAPLINEFIDRLSSDSIVLEKQDESKVSFAPIITKQDGYLDFENITAAEAINRLRAYTPWPGTFTYINNMRIKVTSIEHEGRSIGAGSLDTSLNTLIVGTKTTALRLNTVQLEGKKPVKDFEFINGHKNKFDHFLLTPTPNEDKDSK
jgi:methionyl-tRNA formyltransferase